MAGLAAPAKGTPSRAGLDDYVAGDVVFVKAMRTTWWPATITVPFDGKRLKVLYFDEEGEKEVDSAAKIERFTTENALKRNERAQGDLETDQSLLEAYDNALTQARRSHASRVAVPAAAADGDGDVDEGEPTRPSPTKAIADSSDEEDFVQLSSGTDSSDDDMVDSQFSQASVHSGGSPGKAAAIEQGQVVWAKQSGGRFWPCQVLAVDFSKGRSGCYTLRYFNWGEGPPNDRFDLNFNSGKLKKKKVKDLIVPFVHQGEEFDQYKAGATQDASLKATMPDADERERFVGKAIGDAKSAMTARALGLSAMEKPAAAESDGPVGEAPAAPADDGPAASAPAPTDEGGIPSTQVTTASTVHETLTEITETTTTFGTETRTTTRYESPPESRKRPAEEPAADARSPKAAKAEFSRADTMRALEEVTPDLVEVCSGKIAARTTFKKRRSATEQMNAGFAAARFGRINTDDMDHAGETALDDLTDAVIAIAKDHCGEAVSEPDRKRYALNVLLPEAVVRIHARLLQTTLDEADGLLAQH